MRSKLSAGIAITILVLCFGCASTRNRDNDRVLTVIVDKASFPDGFYQRVVEALAKNGNFRVLEPGSGFQSLPSGGVIKGSVQCSNRASMWKAQGYLNCLQVLSIVSTRTTEVLASVSHEEDSGEAFWGQQKIAPSFERVVTKLWDAYPKHFDSERSRAIAAPGETTQSGRIPASVAPDGSSSGE